MYVLMRGLYYRSFSAPSLYIHKSLFVPNIYLLCLLSRNNNVQQQTLLLIFVTDWFHMAIKIIKF